VVPRTRAPAALIAGVALSLAGCKAESLGVTVPRGGPDAISMEDLQRDTQLLGGAPRDWAGLEQRLQQMRTLPGFGAAYRLPGASAAVVCGQKSGSGDEIVLVAAEDDGGTEGAVALAALISLAKAWDVQRPPPKTLLFCAWAGEDGARAFAGAPPAPLRAIGAAIRVGGDAGALPGLSLQQIDIGEIPDQPGDVDFRALRERVVAADRAVRAG
jgi:hypothetical protein